MDANLDQARDTQVSYIVYLQNQLRSDAIDTDLYKQGIFVYAKYQLQILQPELCRSSTFATFGYHVNIVTGSKEGSFICINKNYLHPLSLEYRMAVH